MSLHELAGKPAPRSFLVNVPRLVSAYYVAKPDPSDPGQRVAFGTSGHRGSSLRGSFNEDHILATSQALVEHRRATGITGPLFLGMDTHALSEPALATALEVFAANGVEVRIQAGRRYTPTPGDLPRDPDLEPRPEGRPRRRRRRHALPQPAGRRRLQVQPARRRPGGTRHHEGGRVAGQRHPRGRPARREARELREGAARRDHAGARLRGPLRRRPGERPRHGRHRRGEAADRRRSPRRRVGRLLGPDRRALPHRPRRREPGRGPDVLLHDPRQGRQDPDGLLVPLRDGGPHRPQGPLRRGLRQRRRRRSPRHRHPRPRAS